MCSVSRRKNSAPVFAYSSDIEISMDVTTTLGWVNLASLGFEEAVFLCACGDLLKKSWLICSH